MVVDLVRGMDVSEAESQLRFMRKASARPVLKLILSAKANAENNFKLEPGSLFIKTITVDGGPVMHRWRPRAFGRATPIRKRTSHITVILDEKRAAGTARGVKAAVVDPGKGAAGKPAAKAGAGKHARRDPAGSGGKPVVKKEAKTEPKKAKPARSTGSGPSAADKSKSAPSAGAAKRDDKTAKKSSKKQ